MASFSMEIRTRKTELRKFVIILGPSSEAEKLAEALGSKCLLQISLKDGRTETITIFSSESELEAYLHLCGGCMQETPEEMLEECFDARSKKWINLCSECRGQLNDQALQESHDEL